MTIETVFMVFYAIFWGAVSNVQPRLRAFHWELFFRLPKVRCRALLSFIVLNVAPLVFFGYILWALAVRTALPLDRPLAKVSQLVIRGVVPAFGIFGLYWVWIAIVEFFPHRFYFANPDDLTPNCRHIEPTYRVESEPPGTPVRVTPVVDLYPDGRWERLCFGLAYLIVAALAPWLDFWRR